MCQRPCLCPQQAATSADVSQILIYADVCCCTDAKRHSSSWRSHGAVDPTYVLICPQPVFADTIASERPEILTPNQPFVTHEALVNLNVACRSPASAV